MRSVVRFNFGAAAITVSIWDVVDPAPVRAVATTKPLGLNESSGLAQGAVAC